MSEEPHIGQPLAELAVSPLRRIVGAGLVFVSGALLVWASLAEPPQSLFAQLALWGLAALMLVGGLRLYQDSAMSLYLFEDRIEESSGALVVPLAHITGAERGMFAFRPSNGFLLNLREEHPPVWKMGLWWRAGRRVAVGGLAAPSATKAFAAAIEAQIANIGNG